MLQAGRKTVASFIAVAYLILAVTGAFTFSLVETGLNGGDPGSFSGSMVHTISEADFFPQFHGSGGVQRSLSFAGIPGAVMYLVVLSLSIMPKQNIITIKDNIFLKLRT